MPSASVVKVNDVDHESTWTNAPAIGALAPWQLVPVTVPISLPQVVGCCAVIFTDTGCTVYGVSSLIRIDAE